MMVELASQKTATLPQAMGAIEDLGQKWPAVQSSQWKRPSSAWNLPETHASQVVRFWAGCET